VVPPPRLPQQLRLRGLGRARSGLSGDRRGAEARPGGIRTRVRGLPRSSRRLLLGLVVRGRATGASAGSRAATGEPNGRARPPLPLGPFGACQDGTPAAEDPQPCPTRAFVTVEPAPAL